MFHLMGPANWTREVGPLEISMFKIIRLCDNNEASKIRKVNGQIGKTLSIKII
jgi:hypothetical protein